MDRLRALGRTEDVMFSPDQTRLAIAGFNENRVLVIQIKTVTKDGVISVQSDACVVLLCTDFKKPHGVAWIDDGTLVVANRAKDAIVVPVPAVSHLGEAVQVEPMLRLSEGTDDLVSSPGSVGVIRLTDQHFDILLCNNHRNYVSRHIVHRRNGFEVIAGLRLLEHDLKIPDSISASDDGKYVAVSNHYGKRVDVFRNEAGSTPQSPPAFSLGGILYPHGVRFGIADRLVLVADAGAPLVHVYVRDGLSWTSAKTPAASIKVIDDEDFRRGQANPQEGGPKGVDILADGSLFVVSCEEVPIAFFDFRSMRDQLVGAEVTEDLQSRSSEALIIETSITAIKGQQAQIATLREELTRLEALLDRTLGRRLRRKFRRLVRRATGFARRSS